MDYDSENRSEHSKPPAWHLREQQLTIMMLRTPERNEADPARQPFRFAPAHGISSLTPVAAIAQSFHAYAETRLYADDSW